MGLNLERVNSCEESLPRGTRDVSPFESEWNKREVEGSRMAFTSVRKIVPTNLRLIQQF